MAVAAPVPVLVTVKVKLLLAPENTLPKFAVGPLLMLSDVGLIAVPEIALATTEVLAPLK
jgi:hypothetical protein